MLAQYEIENGLRDLGVQVGMIIEVHSSLSSFGTVSGGALTVIDALKNVITNTGTILMPSFTSSKSLKLNNEDIILGITSKQRILSEDHSESTDMGIIADTFRCLRNTVTGKGTHRFSAWGNNAEKYVDNFQNVINNSGYGLLLGVDILSLSAMHFVEHNMKNEIWPKLFSEPNPKIKEIYNPKDWFIKTGNNPPYVRGWLNVQKEAFGKNLIRSGKIGNSSCMLFKLKSVVDIYEYWIESDPYTLFEVSTK